MSEKSVIELGSVDHAPAGGEGGAGVSLDPGALMSMFADDGGEDDWILFPSGPVPAVLPSAAHALVDQAKRLSRGSDTDRQLAVIFAQSACEMFTEQMLTTLLSHDGSPLSRVVSGILSKRERDLSGDGIHTVYRALSGDNPRSAGWWKTWESDCRALRHKVAHTGAPVSAVEAESAVKAAEAYIAHVSQATSNAITRRVLA
jgi:hypothetical protein